MVFLLSIILSLSASFLFLLVWERMPAAWLFDVSHLSLQEQRHPHPKSQCLSRPVPRFVLFLFFFTEIFLLIKKVAPCDVFWGLCLFWFLTHIALADHLYRLIPDQWSLGIALLGILRFFSATTTCGGSLLPWTSRISGLVLCSAIFLFLSLLPKLLTGAPALGLGDVKLIFALAIALSWQEYLTVMGSTALLGGAIAAVLLIHSRITKLPCDRGLPYGTVIALTFFLLLLYRS